MSEAGQSVVKLTINGVDANVSFTRSDERLQAKLEITHEPSGFSKSSTYHYSSDEHEVDVVHQLMSENLVGMQGIQEQDIIQSLIFHGKPSVDSEPPKRDGELSVKVTEFGPGLGHDWHVFISVEGPVDINLNVRVNDLRVFNLSFEGREALMNKGLIIHRDELSGALREKVLGWLYSDRAIQSSNFWMELFGDQPQPTEMSRDAGGLLYALLNEKYIDFMGAAMMHSHKAFVSAMESESSPQEIELRFLQNCQLIRRVLV